MNPVLKNSLQRLMFIGLLVSLAVRPATAVAGDKKAEPGILKHIPPDALGFVHIKFDKIWGHPAAKEILKSFSPAPDLDFVGEIEEKVLGFKISALKQLTVVVMTPTGSFTEPFGSVIVVLNEPAEKQGTLEAISRQSQPEEYKGRKFYARPLGDGIAFVTEFIDDRTILFSFRDTYQRMVDAGGHVGKTSGLSSALGKLNEDHTIVAGIQVPGELAQALLLESLPAEMQAFQPLLHLESASATLDLCKKTTLNLELGFPDEQKAKDGMAAVRMGSALAQFGLGMFIGETEKALKRHGQTDSKSLVELLKQVQAGLLRADLKHDEKRVMASVGLDFDLLTKGPLLARMVIGTAEAQGSVRRANSLKQIGIAMHQIHFNKESFPASAIVGKDDKPLLSWRVRILPYIEQGALYKEFRKDEPWDSPHNTKLMEKMPPLFASGKAPNDPQYTTRFQVFTGNEALFAGFEGPRIQEIRDGTSNTILAVEAGKAVPWTKPEDIEYDPRKPLPKLGGLQEEGFNVLFCDGSVRFVGNGFDKELFRKFITPDGGEIVNFEDLSP